MTTLYIRHPARAEQHAGGSVHFALAADNGALVQQGTGALAAMGDMVAQAQRVVLLLAASDVSLLKVKVPPLSNARLKAALANLVEEQVLGDPAECVLVAAAATSDDGMRTVAVVQRNWLESLVKTLLGQGARTVAALPAQLCLPIAPGGVSAAIHASGAMHELTLRLSHNDGLGLAMEAEPAQLLQTVRALAGEAPVTLYLPQDQIEAYMPLVDAATTLEAEHWTHWVAGAKTTTLDLVSGLGAAGSQARNWQRWRWPMRVALLAVLVNIVALNVQYYQSKRDAAAVNLSITQAFKAAYPKEALSDALLQMQRNIAAAKAAGGEQSADEFTYMASAYGEAVRAMGKKPELAALEYRDRALLLRLKPETVDPSMVAQLKDALSARHLTLAETGVGQWQVRSGGGKP